MKCKTTRGIYIKTARQADTGSKQAMGLLPVFLPSCYFKLCALTRHPTSTRQPSMRVALAAGVASPLFRMATAEKVRPFLYALTIIQRINKLRCRGQGSQCPLLQTQLHMKNTYISEPCLITPSKYS